MKISKAEKFDEKKEPVSENNEKKGMFDRLINISREKKAMKQQEKGSKKRGRGWGIGFRKR